MSSSNPRRSEPRMRCLRPKPLSPRALTIFSSPSAIRPWCGRRPSPGLRTALAERAAAVVILGFEANDPKGYGRLVLEGDSLVAIREQKDLLDSELGLAICNAGLMALAGQHGLALLESIGTANAQGEYYLTDAVAIAYARGLGATALGVPEEEVLGINDRQQLAAAEAVLQSRLRGDAMRAGVTFLDPTSVHLSFDTELAGDVTIEPNVFFGPGVRVGTGSLDPSFFASRRCDGRGKIVSSGPSRACAPAPSLATACISAISSR